jgi:hypothetical protein
VSLIGAALRVETPRACSTSCEGARPGNTYAGVRTPRQLRITWECASCLRPGGHERLCGRSEGAARTDRPPPPHCPVASRRAWENAQSLLETISTATPIEQPSSNYFLELPLLAPSPCRRWVVSATIGCRLSQAPIVSARRYPASGLVGEHRRPVQTPICPDVAASLTIELKLRRSRA